MSNCFTPRFGEALDSLRKDGCFDDTTPLEELLSPLDWRLLDAILCWMDFAEGFREGAQTGKGKGNGYE